MHFKETCGPAYLGALETALPFMAAREGLCTLKEADWGGERLLTPTTRGWLSSSLAVRRGGSSEVV